MSAFDGNKTATVNATKTNNNLRNFRLKSIVPFRVTGRSAVNLHSTRHGTQTIKGIKLNTQGIYF